MWNGHLPGENVGRHPSHTVGVDNALGLPPVDAHAVAALASFQHGAAATYNAYGAPPYNIPPVYPSGATEMEYRHHHQIGSHPPYNAGAAHNQLYFHGHHRLQYPSHTEDVGNMVYQRSRHIQDGIDDSYNEVQLQSAYRPQPVINPSEKRELDDGGKVDTFNNDDGTNDDEELNNDFDEDDNEDETDQIIPEKRILTSAPRGKPEAMAKGIAAALQNDENYELEGKPAYGELAKNVDTDFDEGDVHKRAYSTSLELDNSINVELGTHDQDINFAETDQSTRKKSPKKSPSLGNKTKSLPKSKLPTNNNNHESESSKLSRCELLIGERAPILNDSEYQCLESMMTQFCRVPLLAEFSRPVGLLHPELSAQYNRIVKHPVDVGRVCRGIRRRQYKCSRDIRFDMWRVFANCVKFHSHPNNKEAAPSFVSIALHLRDFFNQLWQEYMLPSDFRSYAIDSEATTNAMKEVKRNGFNKRDEDRRKRLQNSGVLSLSKPFLKKKAALLRSFIMNGGCVDCLDTEPVFGLDDEPDLRAVIRNLQDFEARLEEIADSSDVDYTLDNFYHDLRNCYTGEGTLSGNSSLRNRVRSRIDRFFWRIAVPLHEANSRGVTQSSIWGNIAATIWARESSKKPYWPALCLGILPPSDQREGWHDAVTERNEARLPEKLRSQLMTAKLRCEAAQKRQNLSYFLVEFLGTHEFIWVRETDIIENFDPKDDPNKNHKASSKKARDVRKSMSSAIGSKTYQTALEECSWAYDEFESVLQDAFDSPSDNENDENEEIINYSFSFLAKSDDEADEYDGRGYEYDEEDMSLSDVDEANWLISHHGILDTSATGRKNAKIRTMAMKKMANSESSMKKLSKSKEHDNELKILEGPGKRESRERKVFKDRKDESEKSKFKVKKEDPKLREREEKKVRRDLEKKRRKRLRDREKAFRNEERKDKRRRIGTNYDLDDGDRLNHDKAARAAAIVKGYLTRLAKEDDYRSLALSGVMTMSASMVESTGLLGMALAFRAAAGEQSMPDDGDDHLLKVQPWIAIETNTQRTSSERMANLEKQIEILEKEIDRVKADVQLRKKLTEELIPRHSLVVAEIEADDVAARLNHYKKRKKPIQKTMNVTAESAVKDVSFCERVNESRSSIRNDFSDGDNDCSPMKFHDELSKVQ